MPTVAIAHTNERHRSLERVLALVRDALDPLGGIEAFLRPGQTALIQTGHPGPPPRACCSAEPDIIAALIRLAQQIGAANVQVAEPADAMEDRPGTELAAVAAREGAEYINLSRAPHGEVDLPERAARAKASLPVPLLEADLVIAAAKAKTHCFDLISGAIEVCAAALTPNRRFDECIDSAAIDTCADNMTVLRPDLCVTDALVCGEGDGPHANLPRWCGAILASTDPVAMDVAIAKLLRCDWTKLRFAAKLEERGVGRREPIVVVGTPLERIAFSAWQPHAGFEHLPINVFTGAGATMAGAMGKVKSALDELLRCGALEDAIRAVGTPTILIGDARDPEFERHVAEGPYLVFGNAAPAEYKRDPRVFFVADHPELDDAMPQLMRGLKIKSAASPATPRWRDVPRANNRSASSTPAAPIILGAFAIGAVLGRALARLHPK